MSADLVVLDWGIGGFGFLWAYQRRHPEARLVYLSDSGTTPYGLLPQAALRLRLREVAAWSAARGARRLVVACNAASSALDDSPLGLPVSGIIQAGLSLVRAGAYKRVGVIGGRRTIRSRAYATPLRRLGLEVQQRIAQPLSALVEAGILKGARVDDVLAQVLGGLRSVDALVLACTHYPALAERIEAHLPSVTLLDPAQRLARDVPGPGATSRAQLECYTTGDPIRSREAARAAFGRDPGEFCVTRALGLRARRGAGCRRRAEAPGSSRRQER